MNTFPKKLLAFVLPVAVLLIIPYELETEFNVAGGVTSFIGILLMIAGFTLLFATIGLFSTVGQGTLAPWSPPQKLVIVGPYAHTRNPMISGVLTVLLGESLVFSSNRILIWFVLFFLINQVYFYLSEEPDLLKRFGNDYEEYRKNVPRWIPRLSPWVAPGSEHSTSEH